jgi:predicted nuclease of restriction endonuclease-like RecB superfamily
MKKRSRNRRSKETGKYASKFEKGMAAELNHLKANWAYEQDQLTYVIIKKYNPDFKIYNKKGKPFYLETKGYFPYVDRVKMLAVKQTNPDADIRFVFYSDNPVRKNAKMKYSDWCKQYGFPYAIGSIPKEWLE